MRWRNKERTGIDWPLPPGDETRAHVGDEHAAMRIDLNSDMGESFGIYTIGNDARLMASVTSASLAAGFHGGDPSCCARQSGWPGSTGSPSERILVIPTSSGSAAAP